MKASVKMPDGSIVELASKYLKYTKTCYFCISSQNEIINIDTSPLSLGVSIRINVHIFLDLLQDSEPITGAEFENVLDKTVRAMNQKMYGTQL